MAEEFVHIQIEKDEEETLITAGFIPSAVKPISPSVESSPSVVNDMQSACRQEVQNVQNLDVRDNLVSREPRQVDQKYHETTLEDIDSQRMSTMQKGIIAAAVILLIGFVLYYIFA